MRSPGSIHPLANPMVANPTDQAHTRTRARMWALACTRASEHTHTHTVKWTDRAIKRLSELPHQVVVTHVRTRTHTQHTHTHNENRKNKNRARKAVEENSSGAVEQPQTSFGLLMNRTACSTEFGGRSSLAP